MQDYEVNLRTWEIVVRGAVNREGLSEFIGIDPQVAMENDWFAAVGESAENKAKWIQDEERMMSE